MNEQHPITIETILSVFKNKSEEKRLKDIKEAVTLKMTAGEGLFIEPQDEDDIHKQVEAIIKEDKSMGDSSFLLYKKGGKYKQRPHRKIPDTPNRLLSSLNSDYIGRAGELAVMSELMFRGYNVNRMMIDDGIDIIASKNNVYYYVQVKTTEIRDGRVQQQIKYSSFEKHIENRVSYIIVVRHKKDDGDYNMFFKFTHEEIEKAAWQRCILKGENGYSIKMKFVGPDRHPVLYDEKEMDISWNLNRFDL